MPTEDRSLDALKEEGTATVIDGSDDEWLRRDSQRLYSINEGGPVPGHFLYIDENGLVRTDGTQTNKATEFKVHIIDSKDGQVVMLEHKNTQKVVAIDANNDTVIAKVEKKHPDILFRKIPKSEGSALFHLKPYETRMVGFNTAGDPIVTTTAAAESNKDEFLFGINLYEGAVTVKDGSDDGWDRQGPFLLSSGRGARKRYLHIDSNGSLRANGNKDNSDHDTGFTVHSIDTNYGDQIVILEHRKTKKVVAIDANTKNFITKDSSSVNLRQLNNLSKVEEKHPDILFQKIPKSEEDALFHLKPYDTRMVGFNKAGDPIVKTTADAESNKDEFLFKMH
ncbi:uncharacterized protein LOC111338782 isoform X2 [Stylophora pistillata]|uniref:uncharacterized protein LOC111338782 isoform X2 n=1 Tax=Stylophora pistillata TaxID=50429 RepID=UPI000C04CC9D|nr:uncharacterized protein LOC111338782 isoform X2 [Stylophora pistillata]